jgi:retinol dehydrogenase 12
MMMPQPYDLKGRVALVTGATSGIGRVTAEALAGAGATVLVVGRNPEKTTATVSAISAATGNGQVVGLLADLSLQSAVRTLAAEVRARWPVLHILVNNAGAIFAERAETAEGVERTWALNHLSYFLLTELLLESLSAGGTPNRAARIVNVASNAHVRVRGLNFADLELRRGYSSFGAYGQSKLANILFTYELARRLTAAGRLVTANAVHPGLVHTGFGGNNQAWQWRLIYLFINRMGLTPEQGAETLIYLAADPAVEGVTGKYFVKRQAVSSSRAAYDAAAAKQLWDVSERAVKQTARGS